jgi:hypothetical protein
MQQATQAADRLINHVRELTGGEIFLILIVLVWSWIFVWVIAWEVRARWELQISICDTCGTTSRSSMWTLIPGVPMRLDRRVQCPVCGTELMTHGGQG